MKYLILFIILLTAKSVFAKQGTMHILYFPEPPSYEGNDELSMVGEFGFLMADGNTNTSSVTANINTTQEFSDWGYQIIGNALYKQNQQEVQGKKTNTASAQKLFVSSQMDHKLAGTNNRVFLYGEYENNRFNGFHYQAALAAGWTSRVWRDKCSELKYSVGPGYAVSKVKADSNNEANKGLIVRAAIEYKRKFSEQATFRQFISAESDHEFTKTKSETSLSTKLTGKLGMKLSFIMDFDSSVGPHNESLDTEAAISLIYQFL
ncbi:YdiY family protein [uncultured Paraglaciecola sp.]|uniref:DUF481 domain-containing protein n=1 Tax=uncultured Paraglaciecola sp. TaxID=1765024 RepID=UPI002603EB92|nr:DUF481 domain-containing protein [uncultured Paraglaciecola sp.]